MKRQRHVAADPARNTAQTYDTIAELIVGALPRATAVADELARGRSFLTYLISTEATAEEPLVLRADDTLDCDIFTVHGMDALSAEGATSPPGGARSTDWTLCIPVPAGAPFDAADVTAASSHFVVKRAAKKASPARATVTGGLASLVDPNELRKAVR